MGFFITLEDAYTIYFSGSTDLTLDMKLWGELFKRLIPLAPVGSTGGGLDTTRAAARPG